MISCNPAQLAGFGIDHLPSSRPELQRADRRVLCDDVRLTSWLEVDRHGIRACEAYLQKGDVGKAKEQLMEIADRCGGPCDDYELLVKAIAAHVTGKKIIDW